MDVVRRILDLTGASPISCSWSMAAPGTIAVTRSTPTS
jgi:hypothetical protein